MNAEPIVDTSIADRTQNRKDDLVLFSLNNSANDNPGCDRLSNTKRARRDLYNAIAKLEGML